MAKITAGFAPDTELSEIISDLWDVDDNKCDSPDDFAINLQGYVTSARREDDFARHNLFKSFNEEEVFSRPTYKAFRALLDNYEMDVTEEEEVTWEERQENWNFLTEIMKTKVMKKAHQYLSSKHASPVNVDDFKNQLHDIWFKFYNRRGGRGNNSCSFEHVFIGEGRGDEMIGLHNWIQFYLQEKAGNIDYHGYFRRETVKDDDMLRLLAVQFDWKDIKGKPFCSLFLGSSPEFEIAVYTICLLLDRDGSVDVKIGEYEVEVVVHSHGKWTRKLGTAYIAAARAEQEAKRTGWNKR